jgi:hypothetical protein
MSTLGLVVQRVSLGEAIARFFGGGTFSEVELLNYLSVLDSTDRIEDDIDSDNKARAIVAAWKEGGSPYVLTPRRTILLIEEMQSGFTGDDDERAILELLERSDNSALSTIFGAGAINASDLNSDFHGDEWRQLQDFYRRRFDGGMSQVLAKSIRPIGEPVPLGVPLRRRAAAQTEEPAPSVQTACTVMRPENCPTYEVWLRNFTNLPTYISGTGQRVLGPAPAPSATATDPSAPESRRRPPVLHRREPYLSTDRFIDGPTEQWVRANLPPNLVETAYQLPSDCADIAVILRHVWLAAHRRIEVYRGWVCGSRLGQARSRDINELIINEVFTGNVEGVVSPYTDEQGNRLLSFEVLQHILHPGDILVWRHPGSGGHTHTIIDVRRVQGRVTRVTALQGNQPISAGQAEQMRQQDLEVQRRRNRRARLATPSVEALREAPGRRIEMDTLEGIDLQDSNGAWTWPDGTVLVAAGPPAAAARPTPLARRGQPAIRRLTDWVTPLQRTTFENLDSTFESALLETRATIESQRAVTDDEARSLGHAAGDRLRQLARDAGDLADDTHLQRLERMRAQLRALRDASHGRETQRVFDLIDEAFVAAARGISTIDFTRTRASDRLVHVLLTGFDPFNVDDPSEAPRPGEWNPSGAAVRSLDNETIEVENRLAAAVEGVVLPVSFQEFKAGLVESIISRHHDADAVITVSMDPNIEPGEPVDIEQFAVGVHELNNGRRVAIPPAPRASSNAPPIIEARAPVSEIAAETARPASGRQPAIPRPTVDTSIEFEFINEREADAALRALGLPVEGRSRVTIRDLRAVRRIVATMAREVTPESPRISFRAGGRTFAATIREGPGGSFLSNEVSFRVLRQLAQSPGQRNTLSFHVHTQRGTTDVGGLIPQDTSTPEARRSREEALTLARSVLSTLIETLKQMIIAVARRIGAAGGQHP